MSHTLEELIGNYGDPILRFSPHGEFTKEQRTDCQVPKEVAVFKLPKDRVDEYIVFSMFVEHWHPNCGERFVIRGLLRQLSLRK